MKRTPSEMSSNFQSNIFCPYELSWIGKRTTTKLTDTLLGEVFGSKKEADLVYSEDLRKSLTKKVRFANGRAIRSLIFFNDDDNVATSADENKVKIWRLWDRTLLHTFDGVQGPVSQVRVTRDTKQIVGAGTDSRLYLWDLQSGHPVWIRETDFGLLCCDVAYDGNLVVTGSDTDHTILFWDRRTGDIVQGLPNMFSGSVTKTIFSPDGSRMAACALEGPAKLFDLRARRTVLTFNDDCVLRTGLAFSKDGRKLLTSAMNSRLNLYDLFTGTHRKNPIGTALSIMRPACLTCCDFSTLESQLFCCGSTDGRVMIWDADRMDNLFDLISHDGRITGCAFTPNGKYLMTSCEDGTGRLWSISELKNTKRYRWKREKDPPISTCVVCEGSFPAVETKRSVNSKDYRCVFCRLEESFPEDLTPEQHCPVTAHPTELLKH
ncbi:putative WD repeat-containing protein 88 [Hypsibius exemplaris]|uniref:WD repeat-containing protein 88 n=1 Tax=Hypsibius exemplaris TaxID=2072580 RepID=A0A1W0X0S3_HYPEX|nr:putative WD repeat-containing protein 88 [Hypsibius exemplaris]